MKICFLISGQIRGYQALIDLSDKIKEINSQHEITLIISTWSKSGMKYSGALGFGQVSRIFTEDIYTKIPNNYYGENFWDHFENTEKFSKNEDVNSNLIEKTFSKIKNLDLIIDIEDEILNLEFNFNAKDKNSMRMLYKRWRCNEIKKKIEREKNSKFDLVVCSRPDAYLDISNPQVTSNNNDLMVPQNLEVKNYINDVFSYGSSDAINIYTSLFVKTLSDDWDYVHREYYNWIKAHKLNTNEATWIRFKGFEDFKFTYDEIKGMNEFIDYCFNFQKDKNKIKKITNYDLLEANEKSVINYLRYENEYKDEKFESALIELLSADFSLRDMGNDEGIFNGRDGYLLGKLCELIRKIKILDLNDYIKKLAITPEEQLKTNIKKISKSQKYLKAIINTRAMLIIEKGDLSKFESFKEHETTHLDPPVADKLCNQIELVNGLSKKKKLNLYKFALKIKPDGKFIQFKISEYEKNNN